MMTVENAQLGALLAYNRGRNIFQRDGTLMFNDTYVINERWVSETRAMFAHYTIDISTIDPIGPQIDITGFGLFGREIFLPSKIIERHYQAMQTLSYHSGRHSISVRRRHKSSERQRPIGDVLQRPLQLR